MALERPISAGMIAWSHVKGFYRAYPLGWEGKQLLPQHTRLPSPTRQPLRKLFDSQTVTSRKMF
jgi:hypothetical protein